MELKEKNNLFLLVIVAVVAIVAIIIMISTTSTRNYEPTNYVEQTTEVSNTEFSSSDITGAAYTTTTQTTYGCIDTDNGKSYASKGVVTYKVGNTKITKGDYCRAFNGPILVENYCKNGQFASADYVCPYGCSNGRCKSFNEAMYWTDWIDRDDPSGMADYEHKIETPWVCSSPIAVECRKTDGTHYISADQDIFCNREVGVVCYNALNPEGCYDYKVRYLCPKINLTNSTKSESHIKCIETDNGRDVYNKGFTTGVTFVGDRTQAQKLMDHCQTPTDRNLLVEYYCGDDGYLHEEQAIKCSEGCFDGACKKPATGYCGDNLINNFPNEECDGINIGQVTCKDFGFDSGNVSCMPPGSQSECSFNTAKCFKNTGVCGDNIISPGEECEPEVLFKAVCTDFADYAGGLLTCNPQTCKFDTSKCEKIQAGYCGNGVINIGEQCDGTNIQKSCIDINEFTGGELSCYPAGSQNGCSYDTRNCVQLNVDISMINDVLMNQGDTLYITWTASQNMANYLRYISAIHVKTGAEIIIENGLNTIGTSGKYSWTIPTYLPDGEYVIEVGVQPKGYGTYSRSRPLTITKNVVGCNGDPNIDSAPQCEIGQVYKCEAIDPSVYIDGPATCKNDCTFDLSQCIKKPKAYCGDRIINGYEQCDGTNFGKVISCSNINPQYTGGTLSCFPPGSQNECSFNTAGCIVGFNDYVKVLQIRNKGTITNSNVGGLLEFGDITKMYGYATDGKIFKVKASIAHFPNNPKYSFPFELMMNPGIPEFECEKYRIYSVSASTTYTTWIQCAAKNYTINNSGYTTAELTISIPAASSYNGQVVTARVRLYKGSVYVTSDSLFVSYAEVYAKNKPVAYCGDGIITPSAGEECDNSAITIDVMRECSTFYPDKYVSGYIKCGANCKYDLSDCKSATYCGDGIITSGIGEQCDGSNLGQITECTQIDNRFVGGKVICTADCQYDLSQCMVY